MTAEQVKERVFAAMALKAAADGTSGVRPISYSSVEIERLTSHANNKIGKAGIAAALDSLVSEGRVTRYRGFNYEYYQITTKTKTITMNEFEKTIKAHLDRMAAADARFAAKYRDGGKSVGDCCRYIISEVKKTGRSGFTDDEIYGMAVHFFDEEDVKAPDTVPQARVVVSRTGKKTAAAARKKPEPAAKPQTSRRRAETDEERRRRREWENSDLLFNFDEEDVR